MEAAAATRKRANERQLTKDDDGAGDSDGEEGRAFNGENGAVETAGFNVASAEVLATRRIVKAGRRAAPVMAPPAAAAASAPVAPVVVLEAPVLKPVAPIMAATGGVSPFASFATAAQQPEVTKGEEADGEKEEDKGDAAAKEKKKLEDGTAEAGASPAPPPLASGGFGGFAAAASTGGGGTSGGFGSSGFGAGGFGGFSLAGAATAGGGFGSVAAETGAGAGVGISTADGFAAPPTLFGSQSNGTAAANGHDSPQAEVTLHREMVKTGEEDECSLFYYSEAKLFEFNNEKGVWQERGGGEIKIKRQLPKTTENEEQHDAASNGTTPHAKRPRCRLVMRSRGNLRLLLNATVGTKMGLKSMSTKGVCFGCRNAAGNSSGSGGSSTSGADGKASQKDGDAKDDAAVISSKSYAVKFRDEAKKKQFMDILEDEIEHLVKEEMEEQPTTSAEGEP